MHAFSLSTSALLVCSWFERGKKGLGKERRALKAITSNHHCFQIKLPLKPPFKRSWGAETFSSREKRSHSFCSAKSGLEKEELATLVLDELCETDRGGEGRALTKKRVVTTPLKEHGVAIESLRAVGERIDPRPHTHALLFAKETPPSGWMVKREEERLFQIHDAVKSLTSP